MFVLLINMCDACVDTQRKEVFSSVVVQQGQKTVERSAHHTADVTRASSNVTAHETNRNRMLEKKGGLVRTREELNQKAGVKNENDATTIMRKAMGFSEQFSGRPEAGQLDVTNTYNMAGSIAGVPFYPHKAPAADTSHLFCQGGHCEENMSEITGSDARG